MLKTRLGATPVVDVNTPRVGLTLVLMSRSSQCGMRAAVKAGAGRQTLLRGSAPWTGPGRSGELLPNCTLPFELTLAVVKVWLYRLNGKGRLTGKTQLIHCEAPICTVPDT